MVADNTAQARLSKRFEKWDKDGNGVLEPSDFVAEAAEIAAALGQAPDSPRGAALRDAFQSMFEALADRAGVSPQGPLNRDQFHAAAGELFQGGEAAFNTVLGPVAKGIIGLCDRNDDGVIDASEFAGWLRAVAGLDEAAAAEAFRQIDADGNGTLSEDELLAAIREFHFGRLEFELLG
ncbi:EF-hand domain-containing protein [Streptomyces sp. SHP 1-2]|nr:EF-hand domain-containing protein [Streptomyces sp. SHP 1-2]MYU20747.1 EF-hand domain-containing protein [Streptomyces sp. SID8352]